MTADILKWVRTLIRRTKDMSFRSNIFQPSSFFNRPAVMLKIIKKYKYIRYFCYSLLVYFSLSILSALMLPSPLFTDPYSKVLLSSQGKMMAARIAGDEQWRFPKISHVPEKYRVAAVAFEDKRFYLHPGFDPAAIARAAYLNLKHKKIISGASTITMQVVRLFRKNKSRTMLEKCVELFFSLGLELIYSKDEILELYAGHAPYGGNVVGIEAAAMRFFGRGAGDLTWAESCLLAVLPNSPSLIHPGRNRELLKAKRDGLIKKLHLLGHINDIEYQLAVSEKLPSRPCPIPHIDGRLLDTLADSSSGNIFRSTVDFALQKKSDFILNEYADHLRPRGIYNAAVLIIDNRSSAVIAYVGNIDAAKKSGLFDTGNSMDIIKRPRSTGSILKPLLFAAMLDQGEALPWTLIPDIPTQYNGYMPENFDRKYRGAVPAGEALIRSLNVPSVRMLRQYGIHRFYRLLKEMGLSTLHRNADDYGLTLILGGAEGTLMDITSAYAGLARIAGRKKPLPVRILENDGSGNNDFPEISTAAAYLTFKTILEVTRPGNEGYWKNFSSSRRVAWKTGTSFGLRDAWAVGTTPEFTIGVWAGNADGEGRAGLTGLSVAAPLLFKIFNILPETGWFHEPHGGMKQIAICSKSGFLATELCDKKFVNVPAHSHFSYICPYHRLVHLDEGSRWQVSCGCESSNKIKHISWFVLPPIMEHYYKKINAGYKKLPPFRKDCMDQLSGDSERVMNIIYPSNGTNIYIPVGLNGETGEVIFRAVHSKEGTTIFWHLDDSYLGATKTFHHMTLRPEPGKHKLTIVDESGNRLVRSFNILDRES